MPKAIVKAASPISLEFGASVLEPVRSRIAYAFQVFAAIYGYRIAEAPESTGVLRCFYGESLPHQGSQQLSIPALYHEESYHHGKAKLTRRSYAGEDLFLVFGEDPGSGLPDWLGEIFWWLSASQELSIAERDSAGRVPYRATIFGESGLSPRKPHATLLMAWMENALRGESVEALPKAASPIADADHLVVCSHDIDFYFADFRSALVRFLKNLLVAVSVYRDWSYFRDNFRMLVRLLGGSRVGDYLPALLEAATQEATFRSTLFVVPRRAHRRDPNYRLEQIVDRLCDAVKRGFSIGVHGSYRSVVEDRSLVEETALLRECVGQNILSTRQHWLRFSRHPALFHQIEQAGLVADSTLGFSEVVGFRNGASFAFPPYDFTLEKPHEFLEIPLILMDGSLEATARTSGADPQQLANEILGESRERGWGGVSILWHNPIDPISVPERINNVFWKCAKQQGNTGEKWVSVEEFVERTLGRYQRAGLLNNVRLHGEGKVAEQVLRQSAEPSEAALSHGQP